MPRTQKNVRLPELTLRELNWLKQQYGLSDNEVIILAIDQMYHRRDTVNDSTRHNSRELVQAIAADNAVVDHD